MARDRHTPYPAQLSKYLATTPTETFSARSLAGAFDNGQRDDVSALRGIQEALGHAYADRKIVQFHDADGQPLTESAVAGSLPTSLRTPALYALPGVASPVDGFEAAEFDAGKRNGSSLNSTSETVAEASDPPNDEDEALVVGQLRENAESSSSRRVTPEEALTLLQEFPRPGAMAPPWIETRVLAVWLALPTVANYFREGLDKAHGQEKLALIRAGVSRKQKGAFVRSSVVVGNLAELCRTNAAVWTGIMRAALAHYLTSAGGLSADELPALAADPLDLYDNSEHQPEVVLLAAMALGIDDAVLEIIAADCASLITDAKPDPSTRLAERVDVLEREAVELRRIAKDAEKEYKVSGKREADLQAQIEALRAAKDAGVSALDAQLRARAENADAQLEVLRGETAELEAQVQGLEDDNGRLETQAAVAREDRLLREQAEQDAARSIQRVRDLTEQLSRASDSRNLPIDDPVALVGALARPIGQAARHAAERLASGRMREHDHLLLELASTVTQISRRLDSGEEADADESVGGLPADTERDVHAADQPIEDTLLVPVEPQVVEVEQGSVADAVPIATLAPESPIPPLPRRRRRRARFIVRPLGGAGEVGGSALLVRNPSGHAVLLDCGQRVKGEYGLETEAQFHRGIGEDGRLHAILVSHAHIDHVGSLPILHREQSQSQDNAIPVYMTVPTRRLTQIMLEDSAKIQQFKETDPSDLGYVDYFGGTMEAAYRGTDVKRVMGDEFICEVEPARVVPIPDTSFVARFLPVAHVLGSCAIHLTDTENDQTLLYTGDLGPITDPQITLPQYSLQEMLGADLVIMESTYGRPPVHEAEGKRRRGLSGREQATQQLFDAANHAHENAGSVLLPAFSLGRTQELAKIIHQGRADGRLPVGGKIWIAGMGEKIVQVYADFSGGENPWARADDMPRTEEMGKLIRGGVRFDDAVGHVLEDEFSFIIASPAMLTSGWSRQFLVNMVSDPRHAIVMSGYLPRHSGMIPHLHRLRQGEKVNIDGEHLPIRARWEKAGLSAHAPSRDLRAFAQYMTRQADHVSFGMVHGDEAAQVALAEDVNEMPGASAESLSNGETWRPQRPA
jgi:Cft2 family RNA processing exonuclease